MVIEEDKRQKARLKIHELLEDYVRQDFEKMDSRDISYLYRRSSEGALETKHFERQFLRGNDASKNYETLDQN